MTSSPKLLLLPLSMQKLHTLNPLSHLHLEKLVDVFTERDVNFEESLDWKHGDEKRREDDDRELRREREAAKRQNEDEGGRDDDHQLQK
jgi:hypothetical protein